MELKKMNKCLTTPSQESNINDRQSIKLNPGDFFITKHSNLSQAHIIFHLISDEAFNRYINYNQN